MGVRQYPGRCYHSEACMAGVGNDVTHLGTAPHWKHDLIAPLFEPACIEKTSFIRTQVTLFGQCSREPLPYEQPVSEVKIDDCRNSKIIPNLKRSIDQSSRRISRRAKVNAVVKELEKILVTQSSSCYAFEYYTYKQIKD